MRILMAAAECSPLARTGGLGEAVAGLAGAMSRAGHDVTVAMPRYRHLADRGSREPGVGLSDGLYRLTSGDVTVLLVDDPPSFDRAGIYGDRPGEAYDDQWKRWARFSTVIRDLAPEFDVLHAHDAHAAASAAIAGIPSAVTLHNPAYTLLGPLDQTAQILGAPAHQTSPGGALEWFGQANLMKAGMVGADRVTTVSPTFARQITEDPTVSGGLDGVIRALPHPVVGIVNGIDETSWDPAHDPVLPAAFTPARLKGREAARQRLLADGGLDDGVVFGNVGRMSAQKGLHLLDDVIDDLVDEGLRLALAGNGELDEMVDGWVAAHPSAVWHAPFSEDLSRLISAGSDAYLMPSRFEPCGIGQMYAMRYGAPPVVCLTGGLADTVIDLDEDPPHATGFGFRLFATEELVKTVRRAMRVFRKSRAEWRMLQRNGMRKDQSWDASAARYVDVYSEIVG